MHKEKNSFLFIEIDKEIVKQNKYTKCVGIERTKHNFPKTYDITYTVKSEICFELKGKCE